MQIKSPEGTETYVLLHYDFLFVGGEERTISLVEGKDSFQRYDNGDIRILQAEPQTETWVNNAHIMTMAARRQVITKRIKEPNECKVCTRIAVEFGLCEYHGGRV